MDILKTMPKELIDLTIEHLVLEIGIQKAVLLRPVSHAFNAAILHAICVTQIVSINDPATPRLIDRITPDIKGKFLAVQSRRVTPASADYLKVVAQVNRFLDHFTGTTDSKIVAARDEAIAAAVHLVDEEFPIAAAVEAQNLLCGAAITGSLAAVRALLSNDDTAFSTRPDVNGLTPFFDNPLTLAARGGHLDVVTYLLDHGARLDCLVDEWYEARGEKKVVGQEGWNKKDEIFHRAVLYEGDPSALRSAVSGGHLELVRLLLKPQHRLPLNSLEYLRAIRQGARVGRLDIIDVLFQATGRSLSDFNTLGKEMLWEAVRHGHFEIVRMLLDDGVEIDAEPYPAKGLNQHTALHIACSMGNLNMVKVLVDRGAAANPRGHYRNGGLPVEGAAFNGHEAVVDFLIDEQGSSIADAFLSAAGGGQTRLIKALLHRFPVLPHCKWGLVGVKGFVETLFAGNLDIMDMLVKSGVPLHDANGYLPCSLFEFARDHFPAWIGRHLESLGATHIANTTNTYVSNCPGERTQVSEQWIWARRGVHVYERTWQWVGSSEVLTDSLVNGLVVSS